MIVLYSPYIPGCLRTLPKAGTLSAARISAAQVNAKSAHKTAHDFSPSSLRVETVFAVAEKFSAFGIFFNDGVFSRADEVLACVKPATQCLAKQRYGLTQPGQVTNADFAFVERRNVFFGAFRREPSCDFSLSLHRVKRSFRVTEKFLAADNLLNV